MESVLLANALKLVAHLCVPILAAVGVGALLGGIIRVLTQIDDAAISFIMRFASLSALLLWGSTGIGREVYQFAMRLWSGQDLYH